MGLSRNHEDARGRATALSFRIGEMVGLDAFERVFGADEGEAFCGMKNRKKDAWIVSEASESYKRFRLHMVVVYRHTGAGSEVSDVT